MHQRRLLLTAATALAILLPRPLHAQAPGFSAGRWKSVATEHFLFLFPDDLSDWTLSVARQMEAIHDAAQALIGFAPEHRVTVLVDDPSNVSNGSMVSGPLLFLWPTPPTPRSHIGENRSWPEVLAVHEFAHAAHLTRPSRNPGERFFWSLLPIPLDPIILRTPRWMREGYATYVEGRLTGSGRPHGVWRPAVLRTWALEGQLPTYAAVNGSGGYYGGSMAYLVGSAFLDWLLERESGNEAVLPNLWRRLTARQKRSFSSAFAGVFGASPSELYGLFTVAVTDRALALRDSVEAAGGVVGGDLFQRLSWSTGDPDLSPDGQHLAIALRSRDQPSELVVMSTAPDTLTDEQKRRRAGIFAADPDDVEPVERRPRPQKRLAVLHSSSGRGYSAPTFMPDGKSILVVRGDVAGNAQTRPDLFQWRWEEGDVRRITHGEAIRAADPAPDGTWAAGLRCLQGRCDIVRIDLESGAVETLAQGDPLRPYYHPRVSPDGGTIVASVQHLGRWRLVAMDADGSNERLLGPDDGAARFDAEFLPEGDSLVLTSTRGGIHNLESMDVATETVRPITRVLGAAVAPAPSPDGTVFFLSLHSRGWDIRARALDDAGLEPMALIGGELSPVIPIPAEHGETFALEEPGPVQGYGIGPQFKLLLPLGDASVAGQSAGLALNGTDPIGKLAWQLQGMYGSADAWRGGSLHVLWRGSRPWLHAQGFFVQGQLGDEYAGGAVTAELRQYRLGAAHRIWAGLSAGRLDANGRRILGFGNYELRLLQTPGDWTTSQSLILHGSVGRTGDLDWLRWRATGSLGVGKLGRSLRLFGTLAGTDAPVRSFEGLVVGGTEPPLLDPALISQRLAMPALEPDAILGDRVWTVRAELAAGLPVTPFFWAGDAMDDGREWYRVAGIEVAETIAGIPYVRLPHVRFRLGLARTLSDPVRNAWRAWVTLGYRP